MGYNNLKLYPSQFPLLVPLHQRSLQTDTCCVVVLSTATGTLRYSGMAFSMKRDTVRCTCCGTDFSVATDASKCTLLQSGLICGQRCFGMYVLLCGFIHKSIPLTQVQTGVPACSVQEHRNSPGHLLAQAHVHSSYQNAPRYSKTR